MVSKEIQANGVWEEAETRAFLKIMQRADEEGAVNPTFLDIGWVLKFRS